MCIRRASRGRFDKPLSCADVKGTCGLLEVVALSVDCEA